MRVTLVKTGAPSAVEPRRCPEELLDVAARSAWAPRWYPYREHRTDGGEEAIPVCFDLLYRFPEK